VALSAKIIEFLARYRFDVHVSLDGVAPAQRFRGRNTFFILDRILDSWRRHHPEHFRRHLRVVMTVVPPAIPYLADSVDYLLAKGVQRISMAPVLTPFPGWSDNLQRELDRQFERIVASSVRHLNRTGEIPLQILRSAEEDGDRPRRQWAMCGALNKQGLAVDLDGQVYACGALVESTHHIDLDSLRRCQTSLRLGDIRSAAFADRFRKFPVPGQVPTLFVNKEEKYSSYARCAECPYFHECKICPLSIGYQTGNQDPRRVPDYICAFTATALAHKRTFPRVSERWQLFRNPDFLYEQMQPLLELARSARKAASSI
jgi:sulfatase maturation enzyme AslB (radical SAM superfamily)